MGKTNAFLERRDKNRQEGLNIGLDIGFQKCWDMVCICLHDPNVMGKDVFGKERIKKLHKAVIEAEKELGKALLPTKEKDADIKQRDMDALLGAIWGDELCPFSERYPYIKKPDYSKGNKNWRE